MLKKTFGLGMIGLGIGILLVLLLPSCGWVFGVGAILLVLGVFWLCK